MTGLPGGALLGGDRPALVVAPRAADLEISGRKTLAAKAGAGSQRLRSLVTGLDVRLEAVQPHLTERLVNDEVEAFGHVALAGVRQKPVVADERLAQAAEDDRVEVDHTHE